MCKRCDQIRAITDMVTTYTFMTFSQGDVMLVIAYMYAQLQRSAIDSGQEDNFKRMFNDIAKEELELLNHSNPIEPKKFDESFDFRSHLKGD